VFESVEDVFPAIHAARLERTFLFGEVEEVDVGEGDVVEVEVAAEPELLFRERVSQRRKMRRLVTAFGSQRASAGSGRASARDRRRSSTSCGVRRASDRSRMLGTQVEL
jgi:hypothetical protein